MFARLHEAAGASVAFTFDGREMQGKEGDSVAAALLAAGLRDFRDTVPTGVARGPFCMMGACFDCLVEIDGQANRQACLVSLRPGMQVRRQHRGRTVAP